MIDPSPLTIAAIHAALEAGTFLRRSFDTPREISTKEGIHDVVTECDKSAEEMILSSLSKRFPSHGFLAEESGKKNSSAEIVWVIDPLDGTANFARGVPVFSISIAAAKEKNILSGVVYQPITQELFVAEKGKGAYLNGKPLYVSKKSRLKEAMVATGFPHDVEGNPGHCIEAFAKVAHLGAALRRLGSAAIDLAYVAAGRFDAFFEVVLQPWDIAAGKLLVEEAGGRVTRYDGSLHPLFSKETLLATNGLLHQELIDALH